MDKDIWNRSMDEFAVSVKKLEHDAPLSAIFELMVKQVGTVVAYNHMHLGVLDEQSNEVAKIDSSFATLIEGRMHPDHIADALLERIADFYTDEGAEISQTLVNAWLEKCLTANANPQTLINSAQAFIDEYRLICEDIACDKNKDYLRAVIKTTQAWAEAHPTVSAIDKLIQEGLG